jgi:hypothetical protein
MKTPITIGVALATAVSVSTALAGSGSYTGNWPLTVTNGGYLNGSYCLTVTDDGSEGWTHSGSATIPQYQYGYFQVIHGKFMADIVVPLQGQNGVLVFTGDGHNGNIGNGAAAQIEGGEPLYSGVMKVGTKGGC